MRSTLFALGALFSTASQLRLGTSAVGPGELCLVVWLGLTAIEPKPHGVPFSPALVRFATFWALFGFAQTLGALMGLAMDDYRDPASLLHDAIAYVLLAGLSCLIVIEPGASARLRAVAWRLSALGALFLLAQLANAWGFFQVGAVDPWYWDRLRGWSENPNQLALLCAVLSLVSLHLAETETRPARVSIAILCTAVAMTVGILTKSDSFYAVAMAGFVLFLALKFRVWLTTSERRLGLRAGFSWLLALSFPVMIVAALPFAFSFANQAHEAATGVYANDHEGEAQIRFSLWSEAIERGFESKLLGFGPGGHLVHTAYKREPPPNFEAHNTYLDLFTQGGVLAVLSVLGLMISGLMAPLKAKRAALTTLAVGLMIFSTFHLIVRLPIFWFAIALCLVPMSQAIPPLAAARRS